jgi:transcription initiation factor TFIIIB Brf1 subunit/transcription initiation factor TFIIB
MDERNPFYSMAKNMRSVITINTLGIYLRKERPNEVAATILYVACRETGENKTQNELANAAGVTEVAVRSGIRHLVKNLNLPAVLMI